MFGHVERMDWYRMARRMLWADASAGLVLGRSRLGWMDGVKVFFRTTLPCSGGYYLGRGGMSLHDADSIKL